MNIRLSPADAAVLAERTSTLAGSARELAAFDEADPYLASECGVSVGALEARSLLGCGACERVMASGAEASRTGRPVAIAESDLQALSRLEAVVALSSSRIALKVAAIDAAAAATASQEPMQTIGSLVSLGAGIVGFVKSIF